MAKLYNINYTHNYIEGFKAEFDIIKDYINYN